MHTGFVGRVAELDELVSLMESAARDKRGIRIRISGEAGNGKSRLPHECLDALAAAHGYRAIPTECSAVLGGTPFSTLKTLLSETARAGPHLRDHRPARSCSQDQRREDGGGHCNTLGRGGRP